MIMKSIIKEKLNQLIITKQYWIWRSNNTKSYHFVLMGDANHLTAKHKFTILSLAT